MFWMCYFWFSSNYSRIAQLNILQTTWLQRSEWFDCVNVYTIEKSLHLTIACNEWDEKLIKIIVCDIYLSR
jgi:hypothetical protein